MIGTLLLTLLTLSVSYNGNTYNRTIGASSTNNDMVFVGSLEDYVIDASSLSIGSTDSYPLPSIYYRYYDGEDTYELIASDYNSVIITRLSSRQYEFSFEFSNVPITSPYVPFSEIQNIETDLAQYSIPTLVYSVFIASQGEICGSAIWSYDLANHTSYLSSGFNYSFTTDTNYPFFHMGYSLCFVENSTNNYQQGFQDGRNTGIEIGKETGIGIGYAQGYQDGINEQGGYRLDNFLFSIADTPFIVLRTFFNDTLFGGPSLFIVLMSLVTIAIVLTIWRKFW